MGDFSLRQLQYFLACAETGSLTQAAQRCFVSQTAISLSITQLEKALGTPLLLRQKSKGIRLTPAGVELQTHCRRVLKEADELRERASDHAGLVVGTLSLAILVPLTPHYLPGILEHFEAAHPELSVTFVEGSSQEMQDLVLSGAADCALVHAAHLSPHLRGNYFDELRPEAMVAATHPFAQRAAVSLAELSAERLILLDQPPTIEVLQGLFSAAGVSPSVPWRSQNPDTVRSIVGRGLAVSIVAAKPRSTLSAEGYELRFVPLTDDIAPNRLTVATLAGKREPRKVQELLRWLRERD